MTGALSGPDRATQVAELLERILATLPPDTAVMSVESEGTSTVTRITPANPAAAPITVHVEAGAPVIDVLLGRGGYFEVSTERSRYSDLEEPLDEVRALCLAAVQGNYRETIRLKGDDVVSSRAIVTIGSRDEPLRWKQLFTSPFRRTVKQVMRYEPYVTREGNGEP